MEAMSLTCPFCSLQDADEYFVTLHIEEVHTEDSPFVAKDQLASVAAQRGGSQQLQTLPQQHGEDRDDLAEEYVACPQSECGEEVLLLELEEHLDYHLAERVTLEEQHESSLSFSSRTPTMHSSSDYSSKSNNSQSSATSSHSLPHADASTQQRQQRIPKSAQSPGSKFGHSSHRGKRTRKVSRDPESARLGRHELGPHAWESHMPDWLWKKLLTGPKVTKRTIISKNGSLTSQEIVENETSGLVPVLAQLSMLDRDVSESWFCHPAAVHIFALPKEGGFCGYRNIQMLIAYMQGSKAYGYEKFPGRLPTIPALQDAIEHAWDAGFNAVARSQTGGIKGTRKYIGTPEVFALFESLSIPCVPEPCNTKVGGERAYEYLLDTVEAYFRGDVADTGKIEPEGQGQVHRTSMAPLYLQQPGHSITIVGLERRRDDRRNLVVFDPMYRTAPALVKLVGLPTISTPHTAAMEGCRRGIDRLKRHESFELFKLTSNSPRIPAWGILKSFPDVMYAYVFFDLDADAYDIFPADSFDPLFPWFMYGGLFIVHEGRFARVPNDASFDRLGVPALGLGCDWHVWKKTAKNLGSLALAAGRSRQIHHNEMRDTNVSLSTQMREPKTPDQPVLTYAQDSGIVCSCHQCAQSTFEHGFRQSEQKTIQSDCMQAWSPSTSPTPFSPSSSENSWCSCWKCRNTPAFTPNTWSMAGPHCSAIPQRPFKPACDKRHGCEPTVVFPNARAWYSSGTPLSKASKAYVPLSPPSPSPGCDALEFSSMFGTLAQYGQSPRFIPTGFPPSSPPSMTTSHPNPASFYHPITPSNINLQGIPATPLYSSPPPIVTDEVPMYWSPMQMYMGGPQRQ